MLAYLLAEALAHGALRLALAAGELLGLTHVSAVAATHAQAFAQVGSRPPSTTSLVTIFHQHQECRKGDGKQDLRPLRYVNIGIIWL